MYARTFENILREKHYLPVPYRYLFWKTKKVSFFSIIIIFCRILQIPISSSKIHIFFHHEKAIYYTEKLVENKATEVNSGHVSSCWWSRLNPESKGSLWHKWMLFICISSGTSLWYVGDLKHKMASIWLLFLEKRRFWKKIRKKLNLYMDTSTLILHGTIPLISESLNVSFARYDTNLAALTE